MEPYHHILEALSCCDRGRTMECKTLNLFRVQTSDAYRSAPSASAPDVVGDAGPSGAPPRLLCCMLGIPLDMSADDIDCFLEPYAAEIASTLILREASGGQQIAVIEFRDGASLAAFCRLYNDLHFPDYQTAGCDANKSLLLPHCSVCLRRIALETSRLWSKTRFPVFPFVKTHSSGCPVCRLYSDVSAVERKCVECGMRHNVWICMTCARGGCGRYTFQHAKDHFHRTNHPFSLELATGRIWDYVNDSFIHVADSQCIYDDSHAGSPQHRKLECLKEQHSSSDTLSLLPLPDTLVWPRATEDMHSDDRGKSFTDRFRSVSLNEASGGGGSLGLDDIATQKIGNVVLYYESLIQSQLADQSLYYEKLLARQTVRLLEQELRGCGESGPVDTREHHVSRGQEVPTGSIEPATEPSALVLIEKLKLEISG